MIKFVSNAYNLQYVIKYDWQIGSAGKIVFRYQYLTCMQENAKWCWEQKHQQQVIIVSTLVIVHPYIDVVAVQYVHYITRTVWNRNQTKQAWETSYTHNWLWSGIYPWRKWMKRKIENERNIIVDNDKKLVYFIHRTEIYYYSSICIYIWH